EGRSRVGRYRARAQAGQGAGAGTRRRHRPHGGVAAVRVPGSPRPRPHAGPAARRAGPAGDLTAVLDLLLVLRYRKAVTYGHHVLLAALEEHPTATRYEVRFAHSAGQCVELIREAHARRVLVLWSFYSPDFEALAAELAGVRA